MGSAAEGARRNFVFTEGCGVKTVLVVVGQGRTPLCLAGVGRSTGSKEHDGDVNAVMLIYKNLVCSV